MIAIPNDVSAPIGREEPARRLASLLQYSGEGQAVAVFITGPTGIGKTTLLEWAEALAVAAGSLTTTVRVPAMATIPANFIVAQAVRGLMETARGRGAGDLEVLARLSGEKQWGPEAVVEAAQAFGALGHVTMLVDDIGSAPHEAVERLLGIARLGRGPLLLVGTIRTGEASPTWEPEPSGSLPIEFLILEGLAGPAVERLAAARLGAPVMPSVVEALESMTDGNPLHVCEMLRHWEDLGELALAGGFWGLRTPDTPSVPSSLSETLKRRLTNVSEGELALLRILAIMGRQASVAQISTMTGKALRQLLPTVQQLSQLGVIAEIPGPPPGLRISHPLYASLLVEDMGPTKRGSVHQIIFAGLDPDAAPSEQAEHALHALRPPANLESILLRAAEEAEVSGSFRQAVHWYEHLVRIASNPSRRLHAMHRQAANMHHVDPQAAIGLFDRALEIAKRPEVRGNLLYGRGLAFRKTGELASALRDLHDARETAGQEDIVSIDLAIGSLMAMQGRVEEAESIFRECVRRAEGTVDDWSALDHLAVLTAMSGDLTASRELFRQAARLAPTISDRAFIVPNLARLELDLGAWDEATVLLDEAIPIQEAAGDTWKLSALYQARSHLEARRGNIGRALEDAARTRRLADGLGNPAFLVDAAVAFGFALLQASRYEEAVEALASVGEVLDEGSEVHDPAYALATLGEALLSRGAIEEARAAATRARGFLERDLTQEVMLDRLDAEIALRRGDPGGAVTICTRWIEDTPPSPFEHARVLETLARSLLASRDRPQALALGDRALQLYLRLGATLRAAETKRWLNMNQPRSRGRPREQGPMGLTRRELDVLGLVSQGRTNREIAQTLGIGVGTVKRHMEHLIAKCGVRRRTELVQLGLSMGLEDDRPKN